MYVYIYTHTHTHTFFKYLLHPQDTLNLKRIDHDGMEVASCGFLRSKMDLFIRPGYCIL